MHEFVLKIHQKKRGPLAHTPNQTHTKTWSLLRSWSYFTRKDKSITSASLSPVRTWYLHKLTAAQRGSLGGGKAAECTSAFSPCRGHLTMVILPFLCYMHIRYFQLYQTYSNKMEFDWYKTHSLEGHASWSSSVDYLKADIGYQGGRVWRGLAKTFTKSSISSKRLYVYRPISAIRSGIFQWLKRTLFS